MPDYMQDWIIWDAILRNILDKQIPLKLSCMRSNRCPQSPLGQRDKLGKQRQLLLCRCRLLILFGNMLFSICQEQNRFLVSRDKLSSVIKHGFLRPEENVFPAIWTPERCMWKCLSFFPYTFFGVQIAGKTFSSDLRKPCLITGKSLSLLTKIHSVPEKYLTTYCQTEWEVYIYILEENMVKKILIHSGNGNK